MPSPQGCSSPPLNAERTLKRAVESALASRPYPAKIYVVDDGSDIPASDVLHEYLSQIEVIRSPLNRGPAGARNLALRIITANFHEYVAILDADDIMNPERIARQKLFLDKNHDVGVVGTWKRCFEENTEKTVFFIELPTDDAAIHRKMFLILEYHMPQPCSALGPCAQLAFTQKLIGPLRITDLIRRVGTRYKLANIPEHLKMSLSNFDERDNEYGADNNWLNDVKFSCNIFIY